jgi:hypothetical protein
MKRLFVISALVLSGFFVNAQGFSFGPKVGMNITGLNGLQFDKGYDYAYHVGGFAEIGLSDKIAFQPELLWSQTAVNPGFTFPSPFSSSVTDLTKVKLNYISVPLLLNIRPVKMLSIQVGPQFGILVDAKNSTITNVKSAFKSGDFSMMAGVQLKVLAFRFYGRYGFGFSNINDINEETWKSKTLQLGIGLGF